MTVTHSFLVINIDLSFEGREVCNSYLSQHIYLLPILFHLNFSCSDYNGLRSKSNNYLNNSDCSELIFL